MRMPPGVELAKRLRRTVFDRGSGSSGSSPHGWAAWETIPPALGLSILLASVSGSLRVLMFVVGGLVAVLLAGLALFRFFAFVLAVLILRPALEIVTAGGNAPGVAPSAVLGFVFAGPAVLWLMAKSLQAGLKSSPVRIALVVLLVASLLSAIGSMRPWTSLVALLQLAFWALMFVVLDELLESRRDILTLLAAVGLSSVVPLLAGIVGAASQAGALEETKGGLLRVTSTFDTSNQFGRYLMLLLLMAWAVQAILPRTPRTAVLGASVPATVLLLLTYTRSAWLGLAVGLVVIGMLQSRKVLVGFVAVTAILLLVVPPISNRVFTPVTPADNGGGTIDWRLSYWHEVLPLTANNPITGIGLDVTRFETDRGAAPHNDYLRFLVETGVVGVAAYLALLVMLIVTATRATRRRPPGLTRSLGVGFAACVAATMVASSAANLVLNVGFMWYVMAFAAATTSTLRMEATAAHPTEISPPRPPPAGEARGT